MLDRQAKLAIVRTSMAQYSGRKTQSADYTMICCPYHDDSTPSGQIFHGDSTRIPGFYRCLGCGAKRNWNELAKDLGLQTFSGVKPDDRFVTAIREIQETVEQTSTSFELSDLPLGKKWRTFSTSFLRKVGCKLGTYEYGRRFVYMPVLIQGRERGYVRAAMKKDPTGEYPSYLNKKGVWSKKCGLFPFDYAIKLMLEIDSRTMVLVEGPRDALRLLEYGIPAMSILGTQTWTPNKARLLEMNGVQKAVLMFDGDPAGIKATEHILPDISDLLTGSVFDLTAIEGSPYGRWSRLSKEKQKIHKSKLWDPGNVPTRVLDQLKIEYFN